MKTFFTSVVSIIAVAAVAALVLLFQSPAPRLALGSSRSYSDVLHMGPKLKQVTIRGDELTGLDEAGQRARALVPRDAALATRLADAGTDVFIGAEPAPDMTATLVSWAFSLLYILTIAIPLFRIARALEKRNASTQPFRP